MQAQGAPGFVLLVSNLHRSKGKLAGTICHQC